MKVFLAVASYAGLKCPAFINALADTLELLDRMGHKPSLNVHPGNCYIQDARNHLVRDFLKSESDVLFFLDDDVSWNAQDAVRLIEMPHEIVAGVYPYKHGKENFDLVVVQTDENDRAITGENGLILSANVPAGFLRIKRSAIKKLIENYPQQKFSKLIDGELVDGFYDLFPQGVEDGRWWGEDYAFCRLWRKIGGEIWLVPNIDLTHWFGNEAHTGNYHKYLLRQPGGSEHDHTRTD